MSHARGSTLRSLRRGPAAGVLRERTLALRLVAVALCAVLVSFSAFDSAEAQSPTYTAVIVVVGDAPPNLLYNLDVNCLGKYSRIVSLPTSGSSAFSQPGCAIVRYYITGPFVAGYEVTAVQNRITDTVEAVTWTWTRVGRTSTPTSSTATSSTTSTQPPRIAPKISVDPVDFGNLLIGKTATRQTTVRNIGTIPVSVRTAAVTPPFSVSQPSCDLPPGATCTIDVTFAPTAPRQEQAILTVSAIGGNSLGAAAQAPVTGNSEDRGDVLLSTPQFQPTAVGQTSPPADATLTNVGSLPFNVKTVAVTPPFLSLGNKCPVLLQPGQTCAIQLAFRPTAPGPATGAITVSLAGATLLELKGSLSAVAPPPLKESIAFDPATGSFGNTPQGTPPTKINVRLVNTGSIPLTVTAVGIPVTTGKGAKKKTNYVAASGGVSVAGACKGKVLQVREACNLVVTSVNTAAGPRTVTLTAVTAAGTTATFTAKGRVLRRGLTVSGPIQLGLLDSTVPRVAKVTVTNSGELPVVVASVALTNGAKSGFSTTGDTCTKAQLAPAAKCTLNVQGLVTVQPSGAVIDKLVVKGSAGEVGQAAVVGRSPSRAIALVPKVLDFGRVGSGTPVARKVTIRNVGDVPVTIQQVSIGGAGAPTFTTATGSNCIGTVIPAKGTCIATITGLSNTDGSYAATVTATGTRKELGTAALRMAVGITTTTGTPIPLTPPTTVPPSTIAPCPTATLLAERVAPRGRPVTFTGEGFPANSVVQVGWETRTPLSVTADASGRIVGSVMVLGSDPLGERSLVATPVGSLSCPAATVKILIVLDTASPRRPLTRSRPVVR